MIITHTKRGESVIKKNKNAIDMIVYERLERGSKIFIENGIDGMRRQKCGGFIDPIGKATRVE